MQVVRVERRDVWFTLEFSLNELTMIKEALDHAVFEYNTETQPEIAKADSFVQGTFYPFLKKVVANSERFVE